MQALLVCEEDGMWGHNLVGELTPGRQVEWHGSAHRGTCMSWSDSLQSHPIPISQAPMVAGGLRGGAGRLNRSWHLA